MGQNGAEKDKGKGKKDEKGTIYGTLLLVFARALSI